jgi:hypothetical protein
LELEVSRAMSYYSSSLGSSARNVSATSADLHIEARASDYLSQQVELEQVGTASATHIGPVSR